MTYDEKLAERVRRVLPANASIMDFTGRPLKGFIFVSSAGARTAHAVAAWVRQSLQFVSALPAKRKKRHRRRPAPKRKALADTV